jgi:hypothetical protein
MLEAIAYLPIIWFFVCYTQTHRQRGIVFKELERNPVVFFNYKEVSFDKHLVRLLLFRWNWRRWYYESK